VNALDRVLEGRESRYRLQRWLLAKVDVVAQVSLNVPGYPKDVKGSRFLVEKISEVYASQIEKVGGKVTTRVLLENGMGPAALVGTTCIDAFQAKTIAIDLEEAHEWGRILDIDVLTASGAISRKDIKCPPRKCLICDDDGKSCASTRRHDLWEIRDKVFELMEEAVTALSK